MTIRTMAGLGMILTAAGLLVIFFLVPRMSDRAPEPEVAAPQETTSLAPESQTDSHQGLADFLTEYNANYRSLWADREAARWKAAVDIATVNFEASAAASRKLAGYVGSRPVIEQLRRWRGRADLTDLQERQVETAWQTAAYFPGTILATVDKLLAAETALATALRDCAYTLPDSSGEARSATLREIEELLADSREEEVRQAAWEASMQPGPRLKDDLVEMRLLRNAAAREMGYSSYFALHCADYGMTSGEMIAWLDELMVQMLPLYEQLHCWARQRLAARLVGEQVPPLLPAHWLPRRWGDSWPGLATRIDLDGIFADTTPQWIVEQAERFYASLGFDPLPVTFWGRSDLFGLPPDAGRVKSTKASAWHIDLDQDVRSLMNVQPDLAWFRSAHGELGRVHYFLAYSRPEIPPVLRRGSSPALAGGLSNLIELAAFQPAYLQEIGLLAPADTPPRMRILLNQALQGPVVFLPFACGTLAHWEHDLYEQELPRHRFNNRWWELAARYQGIAPPEERNEEFCDPATLPQIIAKAGRSYDDALSGLIMHQLHRYICQELLLQDVHSAVYLGDEKVGRFLHSIMQLGATRDWDKVIRDATGQDLSAAAMLEYYQPLLEWLQEQNEGREVGFRSGQ